MRIKFGAKEDIDLIVPRLQRVSRRPGPAIYLLWPRMPAHRKFLCWHAPTNVYPCFI